MKQEDLNRYKYLSVVGLKKQVNEYIDSCNAKRPHAALQYRTPDKYETDYMYKYRRDFRLDILGSNFTPLNVLFLWFLVLYVQYNVSEKTP